MKLREVFGFELGYSLRRPATWIYAAILFGLASTFIPSNTGGGGPVHLNAPERLAEFALIAGMFGMLVTAALFADAALRDVEAGMDPLLFTSPLGRAEYLGGRFLAALVVNALVLAAIPLALAATMLIWRNAAEFGPFRAGAYVQPFLLFLLPNMVVVGSILFTIAVLTRKAIPVYLGAIGLFVGYLFAAGSRRYITDPTLAALADPFGMAAAQDMIELWTEAERNTRLLGFPATMVANRVVWLAAAAALLVLLHRAVPVRARRRWRRPARGAAGRGRPGAGARPAGGGAARRGDVRAPHPGAADARRRARLAGGDRGEPRLSRGPRRRDRSRPADGVERGRDRLRHLHLAGHAPRRRHGAERPHHAGHLRAHRRLRG